MMIVFSNIIDNVGLYDVGFHGKKFTWCRGKTFKRLDKIHFNNI